MIIKDHWLQPGSGKEKIKISPSANARDIIDPDYLVIHYTATDDASSAINWFMNTSSNPDKIAAHIVLDLDGSITQLIPFNRRANHAGTSTWDSVENFNYHSIGIEIVNPGFAEKLADGSFRRRVSNTAFKTYPASESARIMKATHKHKFWTAAENQYWFTYPKAQLKSLYVLSKLLIDTYHLITAIGHDDISPARKPDPGPAFPWNVFRLNVLGSANDIGKIFVVKEPNTNFRNSFSTNAPILKKLPKGYEVGLIETNGQWSKVYLADKTTELLQRQNGITRSIKTIGWIFSGSLELK
jgi:N-acetylmuramoyl-L-alanine amidase